LILLLILDPLKKEPSSESSAMAKHRETPIEIKKEEFRKIGYDLIDRLSDFLESIEELPVTPGEKPSQTLQILGEGPLPDHPTSVSDLFDKTSELLIKHSLLNGHPKFLGYITSSPAPIGALADLLAATVNPNVGAQILSPMATAIEKQTIKWLAEFIGVSPSYGGILVSGGNMANFTAFLAARTAMAPKSLKKNGLKSLESELVIYCSKSTHTWIEKAAVLFGHGTDAIRWIETDRNQKMNVEKLTRILVSDLKEGKTPFMVVGNAGDVSTGAVDDLTEIASLCKKHDLWFHVDGAYGIPAAVIPEFGKLFEGIQEADSIALDPHKWLYAPLEVGCTLVKNPQHLIDTFSSHPVYYNFSKDDEEPALNYYEYGFQNSRGFRALKVWMALQQVGKQGYMKMLKEDCEISNLLFETAKSHPELEAVTQNLSITTFRFVPSNFSDNKNQEKYLNTLNKKLLDVLQKGGEVFLSNAVVWEKYCLRACVVNFRTSRKHIEEIVETVVREGRLLHEKLQGIST
jgi:aromatic-L-amino-acid/L-tryptophan decarboxylase